MEKAKFLTKENTRFLQIHRHQEANHGQNILGIVNEVRLNSGHAADLEEGAGVARIMFLRLLSWSFQVSLPGNRWQK
jgi:hypothetical protein